MIELKRITSLEQLEEVLEASRSRPQLLFKHSATCPISSNAFRALQQHLASSGSEAVDYWMIVVQESREVSNEVASRLEVKHESPQAILVKSGKAVWNESHFGITPSALTEVTS